MLCSCLFIIRCRRLRRLNFSIFALEKTPGFFGDQNSGFRAAVLLSKAASFCSVPQKFPGKTFSFFESGKFHFYLFRRRVGCPVGLFFIFFVPLGYPVLLFVEVVAGCLVWFFIISIPLGYLVLLFVEVVAGCLVWFFIISIQFGYLVLLYFSRLEADIFWGECPAPILFAQVFALSAKQNLYPTIIIFYLFFVF
jgi:hypothetical protein